MMNKVCIYGVGALGGFLGALLAKSGCGVCVISRGATCDKILDAPLVNRFCLKVMAEAAQIGARIGYPISQTGDERNTVTRQLGALKPPCCGMSRQSARSNWMLWWLRYEK